jgi:ribosome biogenesis SPOUT family RNA methylase Rps3
VAKNLKDEQLRDKLCHGMRDRKLAAELRSNEQLTLEDILKKMRCKGGILKDLHEERERVRYSAKQVSSEIKSGSLDAVSSSRDTAYGSLNAVSRPQKGKTAKDIFIFLYRYKLNYLFLFDTIC